MADVTDLHTARKRNKTHDVRRHKFVEAMAGVAQGNLTKAARVAGYKQPHMQGSRLMKRDDVASELEARLARVDSAMGSDEILRGLTDMARGTIESKRVVEEIAGGEAPITRTRLEYNRHAGYESMAKIRRLMDGDAVNGQIVVNVAVALQALPAEAQASVYSKLVGGQESE